MSGYSTVSEENVRAYLLRRYIVGPGPQVNPGVVVDTGQYKEYSCGQTDSGIRLWSGVQYQGEKGTGYLIILIVHFSTALLYEL